ncbi:hypothetical protein CLOSCI_01832 [[Clostridium] scindens ATCC 35704]|nr:hypothetical protein CLOSCI_01832 [[Clostridium] scindens ATCC 35704]
MRIPLERNSLHASAGRLSAPNGMFKTCISIGIVCKQHII